MLRLAASRPVRIRHSRFVFARDRQNFVRTQLRIEGGALQKIERAQDRSLFCPRSRRSKRHRSPPRLALPRFRRCHSTDGRKILPRSFCPRGFSRAPAKLFRARESHAGRRSCGESLRRFFADGYADSWIGAGAAVVEVTTEPAFAFVAVGVRGGLPDFGRAKMGTIWIGITNPLHDAEVAFIEERLSIRSIRGFRPA